MLDKKLALCLAIPHISINVFTHPFLIDFVNELDPRYQVFVQIKFLKNKNLKRYQTVLMDCALCFQDQLLL